MGSPSGRSRRSSTTTPAPRSAKTAGFDLVEVHRTHGYLPSDFLSRLDNRRLENGGSLRNRRRSSLDIARGIVAQVGPEMLLVWPLNGDDCIPGGFGIDEAVVVARWLEEASAAAVSVTAGTRHTLPVTLALSLGSGAESEVPMCRRQHGCHQGQDTELSGR
jgi:2,4-dienoyl-CoA reductase-like NADH-dependent reductase (Old Yellow Enzyme family)